MKDYTIGKVLEYLMYEKYYVDEKILWYNVIIKLITLRLRSIY